MACQQGMNSWKRKQFLLMLKMGGQAVTWARLNSLSGYDRSHPQSSVDTCPEKLILTMKLAKITKDNLHSSGFEIELGYNMCYLFPKLAVVHLSRPVLKPHYTFHDMENLMVCECFYIASSQILPLDHVSTPLSSLLSP